MSEAPGVLSPSVEISGKYAIRTPDRTNIRIRSPRLGASGRWGKVDKGSRHIRFATSGKELALRVAYEGLSPIPTLTRAWVDGSGWMLTSNGNGAAGSSLVCTGTSLYAPND